MPSLHASASPAKLDRGSFGPFMRSLNVTSYGYAVRPDITGSAPTSQIEMFEVHPGDCAGNRSWNDCDQDRERSELSEIRKGPLESKEYWYGWSLFFPESFPNVHPTKVTLGQFHQYKSHPVWMFQHTQWGYQLSDQVNGRARALYPLIEEGELRGRWHKIEVNVRWTTAEDGYFRVWVNNVNKVNYAGRTMDDGKIYFKYGVYRAFISRFKTMFRQGSVPPQVVYFSNVKRGSTREDLKP